MVGIRGRPGRLAGATIALAIAVLAPATGARANGVSTADRQATFAYLQARYEYVQAVVAHDGAMIAATRSVVASVKSTCPNVLAGAPREEFPDHELAPRALGEADRRLRQHEAIVGEIGATVSGAQVAVLAPYAMRFDTVVGGLHWSDPRVAAAVAAERSVVEAASPVGAAQACADLRTWAQSGFHKLAAYTRERQKRQDERLQALRAQTSLSALLARYEGPAEHRLQQRTARLERAAFRDEVKALGYLYGDMMRAFGLPVPHIKPEPKALRLGHGVTRAGLEYEVTEHVTHGRGHGCRREILVGYSQSSEGETSAVTLFGGSTTGSCLPLRSGRSAPHLECEAGALTITALLGPAVRRVRLRLADGDSITSRTIPISAAQGGPAGIYVQALGQHAARPTALVELDARGRVIATESLPRHSRCPTRREEEPQSTTLAHGVTPSGNTFAIEGTVFPGLFGHHDFALHLEGGVEPSQGASILTGSRKQPPFSPSLGYECAPRAWTVVYGVLRAPGTSVSAVTAAGEVPLTLVRVPAWLHAGGVLAYGVFTQSPARVVVRDGAGHLLASEDLGRKAGDAREYCEGYAEP